MLEVGVTIQKLLVVIVVIAAIIIITITLVFPPLFPPTAIRGLARFTVAGSLPQGWLANRSRVEGNVVNRFKR